MADGSRKRIEDVEVGDKVIATDPETGEQLARKVTRVWVHDDTVVDLVIGGDVVTTTTDHRFWSATDQRFEPASQLDPGEQVLAADGRLLTVTKLRLATTRQAQAYNLTIAGTHTYHISPNDILVHNDCTGASIDDLLRPGGNLIGKAGTDDTIREVAGGLPEARAMFRQLSQGGTVVEQTAKLTRVRLANGGLVQLRTVMTRSSATAATIDVNIPDLNIRKLKYNP